MRGGVPFEDNVGNESTFRHCFVFVEFYCSLSHLQTKMRRQSEQMVLELKSELLMSTEQLDKIKDTEATLRSQLSFAQQVL